MCHHLQWASVTWPQRKYVCSSCVWGASQEVLVVKSLPASADGRDLPSVPELGRSPGEGNSNPLQYSCLENPTDRGAWRATVHRVPNSVTQLSDLACTHPYACVYMCANPHMAVCIDVSLCLHVEKEQFWSLDCQVRVFCLACISFKEQTSAIIFKLGDHSKSLHFLPLLMKTSTTYLEIRLTQAGWSAWPKLVGAELQLLRVNRAPSTQLTPSSTFPYCFPTLRHFPLHGCWFLFWRCYRSFESIPLSLTLFL